jgi:3-oxoacyl-[acyl-carrier protein] reductase
MSYNIDVNLKSCILCCREAAKIMMLQQYGKIINMSSLVHRGSPMQFSYSAAKGGVFAFNRTMAMALGMYNINVNALAPALVEVAVIKNALGQEMWEALKKDCEERYPLGRVCQPIDVANCALFLASDESSFITGQIIEISGGSRL